MQNTAATWVALRCELASTSLDPATLAETRYGILPAGSKVADAAAVLRDAEERGRYSVVVRVHEAGERTRLERVVTRALREALGAAAPRGERPELEATA